jgi:hypothetical protein
MNYYNIQEQEERDFNYTSDAEWEVHHPSSASVLIMDGQHLARRLMDRDPIWDGRRLMSEMDGDGWKALLDQMCSGRVY